MPHWTDSWSTLVPPPCRAAWDWARTQPDEETAWSVCNRGDWMLYWLGRGLEQGSPAHRKLVRVVVECARPSLPYAGERWAEVERVYNALDRWAAGEAMDLEELLRVAVNIAADAGDAVTAAAAAAVAADAGDAVTAAAAAAIYAAAGDAAAAAIYAAAGDAAAAAVYAAAGDAAAAAIYAAAVAAVAGDAADARRAVLAQCADIVRQHYPCAAHAHLIEARGKNKKGGRL